MPSSLVTGPTGRQRPIAMLSEAENKESVSGQRTNFTVVTAISGATDRQAASGIVVSGQVRGPRYIPNLASTNAVMDVLIRV